MHKRDLPPYLAVFFITTAILAGWVAIVVDRYEMQSARAEIALSHPAMARIVAYEVEPADYTEDSGPTTVRVERDRYLLYLDFVGFDGERQQAVLEWFNVQARNGLPLGRSTPWLGGLEELNRQPLVHIYQNPLTPEQVRLAHPLDALARPSAIDPTSNEFDPWFLLTFSLLIGLLFSILYGVAYRLYRAVLYSHFSL